MDGQTSNTSSYDVVVVGAGIEGSSAAYHCVKAGKKVLLLEQFSMPHTRGSSHGATRIMTFAMPMDLQQKMMEDAYPMWRELEKETDTEIYRETGLLVVKDENCRGYGEIYVNAMKRDGDCETLTKEERGRRFPHFIFSPGSEAYFYRKGGYVRASKALKCFQDVFVKNGGMIRDGEKMLEIIPGAMVTVKTSRGEHRAHSLILTPGPWAASVLKPLGLDLPLQPGRVHHMYWAEKTPGTYSDFPVFCDFSDVTFDYSGLSGDEYPGMMKMSKWMPIPISGPEERDTVDNTREIEMTRDYIREHFPELDSDNGPAITEACIATTTPDQDYIIDVHPSHSNIAIGCGFSGHGFAPAPSIGKILSQLALGDTRQRHDLRAVSISRFLKGDQ